MNAATETRQRLAALRANALATGDHDTVQAVDLALAPVVCEHNDSRARYTDQDYAAIDNAHRRPGEDF